MKGINMNKEDKKLLLEDLCARQIHNVKCRVKYSFNNETTDGMDVWTEEDDTIKMINPEYEEAFISYISEWVDIENVKPYLRPMESMTKDEKEEYDDLLMSVDDGCENTDYMPHSCMKYIDWLNEHHFDYRGLIQMGLALEAPEGMYKF